MDRPTINHDKLIERLKLFNYKYKLENNTLTVYLSMLCYLKINLATDKVKFTSHVWRLSFIDRLEYVFLMYAFIVYLLAWYIPDLNKGVFVLFGIILIYIVICFIKTENMKSIIHNWIETDFIKSAT